VRIAAKCRGFCQALELANEAATVAFSLVRSLECHCKTFIEE
jgi:hypothetical protein